MSLGLSNDAPTRRAALVELVGAQQLLYGSDRPIVERGDLSMPDRLDWDPIADATRRARRNPGSGAQ